MDADHWERMKLIFKAAGYNAIAGPNLVIDRTMTLKGHDVVID